MRVHDGPLASADRIEYLSIDDTCPHCHGKLKKKGTTARSVIDVNPPKTEKILYECEKYWCPKCRKTIQAKPNVLPKSLYGNSLIVQAVIMHYFHGIPVGRIESMYRVNRLEVSEEIPIVAFATETVFGADFVSGSLFDVFHRIAKFWEKSIPLLVNDYRKNEVKQADETGWRTDGHSGYAWLFCSETESIFKFEKLLPKFMAFKPWS